METQSYHISLSLLAVASNADPSGRGWLHPYSDRDLLLAVAADGVAASVVVGAVLERFGVSPADARREIASLATEPQY